MNFANLKYPWYFNYRKYSALLCLIFGCLACTTTMPKRKSKVNFAENQHFFKKNDKRYDSLSMINLTQYIPGIVIDLRYAGYNNFMHIPMYKQHPNTTFLRKPAAEALKKAQEALNQQSLSLVIWDGYRPYDVTVDFWNKVHDERYVANPKNGSGHNRGIAVDVSIINLKNGQLLNMGTDFDNFTDSAHANFMGLPDSVLANRRLLRQTMQAFGFEALPTEWWHNSWPNAKHFPILNVTFKQLQRMTK